MLNSCLVATLLLIHPAVQENNEKLSARGTREVVLEVPGVTCVGRFTESLNENFVAKNEGVLGVAFEYLSPEEANSRDALVQHIQREQDAFFGRWGRLVFRVDANLDEKAFIKAIVDSRLYAHTNSWILVSRTPLSALDLNADE